ncbi:squalene synthase HpnC [Methylobacillus flagellatus]|uniref:squalene synthase HpnC n=1 Tax=Methylobacillus flagellatus TaxID=405 RepID=UPI0010FA548A|nr:squalene synthase HpnC [Methylobacillus flagellatus]
MEDHHTPQQQSFTQAISARLARNHYENFPVASLLLPRRLREPIQLIYSFARQADDFADEGDLSNEERLQLLDGYRNELDRIKAGREPHTALFVALGETIEQHQLPLQPFYDLLSAFSQDVTKQRYADFGELMSYCRWSANPVGRLLLHLYGEATPRNIGMADAVCSSLQIINFLQDVNVDYKKGRIYLPQDELKKYGIQEQQFADGTVTPQWRMLMEFQILRATRLLQSGAPLGVALPGRIGLEMRTIIAGGERILHKLHKTRGDIFAERPVLQTRDWGYMLYRAIRRK